MIEKNLSKFTRILLLFLILLSNCVRGMDSILKRTLEERLKQRYFFTKIKLCSSSKLDMRFITVYNRLKDKGLWYLPIKKIHTFPLHLPQRHPLT